MAAPVRHADNLKRSGVTDVVLGIRPENIYDPHYQATNISPAPIEANVDVVEQMGNEKIVYLEEGGKSFVSRMDPRTSASVGQRMQVLIDVDTIHLFDAKTQKSLLV
jgi:multiple sugar transport system ATP-binding protein